MEYFIMIGHPDSDPYPFVGKAIDLLLLGKYKEILVYFDRTLAVDPKNVLAIYNKCT
jgi:hypothetical protein